MPKKSKKSTESEWADAPEIILNDSAAPESSAGPAGRPKKAAKARSRKPAPSSSPDVPTSATTPSDAEAGAQAADTFDDAIEANDAREHSTSAPEPEAPTKKSRARKTTAKAAPEPQPPATPEPEPAKEVGPDEDAELEGDWESGSGSDDEQDEEPETVARPPAKLERLQKILAAAGVASRRHAEELITEGRVQVNGQVVTTLGSKADAARDHIRVDGKLLHGAERLRYFVLNKPRGYVTTVSDPEGRPTVMEFFSKMGERLYPVGRLDFQSEGLLLMTNDGDLANRLTRAASGVEKTYLVKVSGQPDEDLIEQLREGVSIDRGRPGEGRVQTAPARIRQVRVGENPWYEVSLIEGRNRELRKMFEEIGHHVEKIRRVGYGPLVLDLEPGHFRELDTDELQLLRLAAEGKWKPKRVKTTTMLPREAGRSVDHERGQRGGKPFRGRDNRRGQERFERPGQQRQGSRPGTGRNEDRGAVRGRGEGRTQDRAQDRTQDRGRFERPARQQREFGSRGDRAAGERSFEGQRGPKREYPSRPRFESDRNDRGERPRRQGGFGTAGREDRRPGGMGAERGARREGGFAGRQSGFGSRPQTAGRETFRQGRGGTSQGSGFGDRPERRQTGQGGGFRPRPGGARQDRVQEERPQQDRPRPARTGRPAGAGFPPRSGGSQGGGSSQARSGFGQRSASGPPRGNRSRGPGNGGASRNTRPEGRSGARPPRPNSGRRPGPRPPR